MTLTELPALELNIPIEYYSSALNSNGYLFIDLLYE